MRFCVLLHKIPNPPSENFDTCSRPTLLSGKWTKHIRIFQLYNNFLIHYIKKQWLAGYWGKLLLDALLAAYWSCRINLKTCSIITQKNHENNKLLICLLPGHSWLPNLVEIQTARKIKWHVISWKSLGGCESVVLGSSFESDRHQKTATQKAADGIWTSDYTEGEDEPRWPPRMTSAFFSFPFFVLALFFCGRSWISTLEKKSC